MLFDPKWEVATPVEPWRLRYLRAAENIERRGWCQGRLEDAEGRVCLVQAMRMTAMTDSEGLRLCAYLRVKALELPKWNDAPGM